MGMVCNTIRTAFLMRLASKRSTVGNLIRLLGARWTGSSRKRKANYWLDCLFVQLLIQHKPWQQ